MNKPKRLSMSTHISVSYNNLNNTQVIRRVQKNESFGLLKTTAAGWKAKRIQKKAEESKKMQDELDLIYAKMKKIKENRMISRGFIEERKVLLDQIDEFQGKINSLVCDIQNIRKNNENLHQESLKLSKKTQDLHSNYFLYRKEQLEIEKEIENLENDIFFAAKQNKSLQEKIKSLTEKVEISEETCEDLKKQIKFVESEKIAFMEETWKNLKKIKTLTKELSLKKRVLSNN
jgi:uncharacterized coiled-coil DUF342 family protein